MSLRFVMLWVFLVGLFVSVMIAVSLPLDELSKFAETSPFYQAIKLIIFMSPMFMWCFVYMGIDALYEYANKKRKKARWMR